MILPLKALMVGDTIPNVDGSTTKVVERQIKGDKMNPAWVYVLFDNGVYYEGRPNTPFVVVDVELTLFNHKHLLMYDQMEGDNYDHEC